MPVFAKNICKCTHTLLLLYYYTILSDDSCLFHGFQFTHYSIPFHWFADNGFNTRLVLERKVSIGDMLVGMSIFWTLMGFLGFQGFFTPNTCPSWSTRPTILSPTIIVWTWTKKAPQGWMRSKRRWWYDCWSMSNKMCKKRQQQTSGVFLY